MIGISVALCLTMLVLIGVAARTIADGRTSEPRQRVASVLEKVPYRKLIADGVVELFDGKLVTAWAVSGPDAGGMSYQEYADLADDLNAVYKDRDVPCAVFFDDFRQTTSGYIQGPRDHRDPTTTVMHEAREANFEKPGKQFVSEKFYSLVWTPPTSLMRALQRLATSGAEAQDTRDALTRLRDAVKAFEKHCAAFEESLPPSVTFGRLRGYEHEGDLCDQLLEFLHRCVTGEKVRIKRPRIALVQGLLATPLNVNHVICDEDIKPGFLVKIGQLYQQVISVETFTAGGTTPGAFDVISSLKVPLRISVRVIALEPEEAKSQMDARYRKHLGNTESPLSRVLHAGVTRQDKSEQRKAAAAEEADTTGDHVRWLHWNIKVVLISEDPVRLASAAKFVKKALRIEKIGARIEQEGNAAALAATWPGEIDSDRSGALIDTLTAADLTPICAPYRGPAVHPNPNEPPGSPPTLRALTTGNTPIDFYDCVEDLSHIGIVGETGGGKSVTELGIVYCQRAMYSNIDHFLFDQGRSAERYVRAAGGAFSLADPSDESGGLNPFHRVEDESERHRLELWLMPMFEMQRQIVSAARQEAIAKALRLLAKSTRRSMSLFQAKLETMDPDLAKALTFWTIRGPMGYLLDSEVDHFTAASLQAFELERLMRLTDGNGNPDARATAPYITLLFGRIRDASDRPGRKVRVWLDEPQDYFKDAVFSTQVAVGYDRGRKADWGMGIATQRFAQFMNSPVAGSIIDATKTWLFTPSAQANGEFADHYARVGVTPEGRDMIARAKKKRHVVAWQDGHLSLLNMNWTPKEMLMLGASSKEAKAETTDLRSRYPAHWPAELYRRHHMEDAAQRWLARAKELGLVPHGTELAA